LPKQVGEGQQGHGIGIAGAQGQLLAFQFGLVGVDEAIEQLGMGFLGQVGGKVAQDVATPVLMVDAGRLVAGDEQVKLTTGQPGEHTLLPVGIARPVGQEILGRVDDAARPGIGAHPVDILADVQGQVEDAVGIEAGDKGGELATPLLIELLLPLLLPVAKAFPLLLAL
jgi:hypothetical protein